MKKINVLVLSIFLSVSLLVGCGASSSKKNIGDKSENKVQQKEEINNENEEELKESTGEKLSIKITAPAGGPTLSMLKMMKEKPLLGENVETEYESIKSTDLLASKIISKKSDILIVPTNLAAKFYNKGIDYKIAATGGWGNLFIVSSEKLNGWKDLKGKEIYMIGKGLTPDIIVRYLLKKNGLDPEKDVKLTYLSGSTELAPTFIAGKSKISLMPEPMLSAVKIKKKETNLALDIQKEWQKVVGGELGYPQASVYIKKELVDNHSDVVDKFLEEYKNSIDWINANPSKAGEYAEELNIGLKKGIVAKALPGSNLTYKSAIEAKESIDKFLKVLMDFSKESIGGKLPDEEFYLQK